MKYDPNIPQDPKMSYTMALAFEEFADSYLTTIPPDKNEGARFVGSTIGQFIAAVTNLTFAIELYLKTLRIMSSTIPQKGTHSLLELFDGLPAPIQNALEATFQKKRAAFPETDLAAIELGVTDISAPPLEPKPITHARKTLRDIFNVEKDAFQIWRYVFQTNVTGGGAVIRSDYRLLSLAAHSIRHHLKFAS
jgi:hypothetical protein